MIQGDSNTEEIKKAQKDDAAPVSDLPIKAAFIRYDSPFTRLIAPLIATRYLWPAIEAINPGNFLDKGKSHIKPGFWRSVSLNFTALSTGATFLGIIGLYSKNTLHDIHSLYSEAVGYELGKDKKDVTLRDIFQKSDNEALKVTRHAYVTRTAARIATAAAFFVPWHRFRGLKHNRPKYEANANAGIGAVGIYLLGEGFLRQPSFFDMQQALVATAINRTNARSYGTISPQNIQGLFIAHRRHFNKNYKWPDASCREFQDERLLTERIADLMNETYNNTHNTENANFTIGKFNYLIGFGLLDKFPNSLAFVELANKSTDMRDVKSAAAAIKNGQNPQEVFQQFGIDIKTLPKYSEQHMPQYSEPFVTKSPQNRQVETKFTDSIAREKEVPLNPQTHLDFAAKTSNLNLSI